MCSHPALFSAKIAAALAAVSFLFYQDMHSYQSAVADGTADHMSRRLAILFFVITIIAILVRNHPLLC
jgi:hypothetical protein